MIWPGIGLGKFTPRVSTGTPTATNKPLCSATELKNRGAARVARCQWSNGSEHALMAPNSASKSPIRRAFIETLNPVVPCTVSNDAAASNGDLVDQRGLSG